MKLLLSLFLLVLCLFPVGVECSIASQISWAPMSNVSLIGSSGNRMIFRSTGEMPLIQSPTNLFLNANTMTMVKFNIKTQKSYLPGRLFFKRIGDRGFGYQNSVEFQNGIAGRNANILMDMSGHPNWNGVLDQLVLNPISSLGDIEISDFQLLEPSPILSIVSSYKEFMTFEMPQLRTVNFIYGPKVGGRSVNYYLYLLIIMSGLSYFAYLYLKFDLKTALSLTPKAILIACLFSWVFLDVRGLVDQIRTVIMDRQTYAGLTLDEKRARTVPGDFYDYIKFCDSNVPMGSKIGSVFPTYYYYKGKAAYYLFPIFFVEKNPDYILVYDPENALRADIDRYVREGFGVYAKFKEGKYILKK